MSANKYDVMQSYSFTYTDCDGKVYNKTISTPGATWSECLNDYVRFLESIFQYDIMSKVRLQEPIWLSTMYEHHHDWLDPWTGEYFVKEYETTLEDLWSEEE
jgi:hypothetical protein